MARIGYVQPQSASPDVKKIYDEKLRGRPINLQKALAFAWRACWRRFGLFAMVQLAIFFAWVALEVAVIAGQRLGVVWWAVAHLAFLVFFSGAQLGLLRICLALCDGGEPTLRDAFACLADGPRFLAAQLVYLLLVTAGGALLLLPGLYLAARYAFLGFAIADGEPGLVRPFQHSAHLAAGSWGKVLALLFGVVVLNVLGASLLGVGLLVTIPLSFLTMTAIYRQLGGD